MNNKFYVPFETAKQLKEKGYPQLDNEWYYNSNGEIKLYQDLDEGYKEECPIMLAHYYFAAPTYHEVVDWLEGKGIIITVESDVIGDYRSQFNTTTREYLSKWFSTREEALNAAILKALEII